MIVRRENGGVGQGYSFAVACKTSVATGCSQMLFCIKKGILVESRFSLYNTNPE